MGQLRGERGVRVTFCTLELLHLHPEPLGSLFMQTPREVHELRVTFINQLQSAELWERSYSSPEFTESLLTELFFQP